jgi:hypothetical protein
MSRTVGTERRKADRVEATLNLNLHLDLLDGGDAPDDLETINVSSSGVYFRSQRYIEPMTKLALSFDVEVADSKSLQRVDCEGIVARIVPEIPEPDTEFYEVAVFFTTIDADSLHNLERYIALRLTA